jgi:hypothetical protein
MSSAKRLGSSRAAKRPPLGISVQRCTLKKRSAHSRGGLDISLGNSANPAGVVDPIGAADHAAKRLPFGWWPHLEILIEHREIANLDELARHPARRSRHGRLRDLAAEGLSPQASDDDRDGYDHPANSAARLLMRTGLFSALFVAFASLTQCDGNRLLLWLAGLHLRFDV